MTNTASTFLVATLVLSSRVYTPLAFSPTSLIKERSLTSPSARFYAPKNSLNGANPKQRRGRNRKSTNATSGPASVKKKAARRRPRSTTTTAAAAAVADAGTAKRRASKTPQATQSPNSSSFDKRMLEHGLLTKDEEQYLGTQIRRAGDMKDKMAAWIEENRARILQQQEYQRLESIAQDNLYTAENELNGSIYGSCSSQAMERHFIEEAEDDIFYPFGAGALEEEGEDDDMIGMSVYEPQLQQLQPSVPEDWMDEILMQNEDTLTAESMTILTDNDIRDVLDLPGGRSELRKVLLEGALAREKLIRSNVRLVHNIAKKWVGEAPKQQGNSLVRVYTGASSITGRPTLDEALQEGILGLGEAADRFDPDRGFRFSTYATMWVTNSVRKVFQLESTSGMRLPIPYYDIKRKYVTRVRYYTNLGEPVPTMSVLADELGVSMKRLIAALQLTQPLQSLDTPIGGASQGSAGAGKAGGIDALDDGYTLASTMACDEPQPEDHVERSLLRQCLENAMATELSPNERDVIRLRLGLDDGQPLSVKEVAEIFGGRFSRQAIRSIEKRAFNKLRSPLGIHTQQLIAYLDFAGIDGNKWRR